MSCVYTVATLPAQQGAFFGLTPARVVDTRVTGGCIPNGSVRDISLEVFDLAAAPPRGDHKVWILRPKVRR